MSGAVDATADDPAPGEALPGSVARQSQDYFRMLAENAVDGIVHARAGRVVWVSPSIEKLLGAPAEYWLGRELRETVPAEGLADHEKRMKALAQGREVQDRLRLVGKDGVTRWVQVHSKPFRDAQGRQDGFIAALRPIDSEVAAEQAVEEWRRKQQRSDARFRRMMATSGVGMCLTTPDGRFDVVNEALCEFLGYDEPTLCARTWQDVTAADYLAADLKNTEELVAGRLDTYRVTKQFVHADRHLVWGDLSASCLRDPAGNLESFVAQIVDVTAEVTARAQAEEARRRQAHADALYRRSMDSAAVGMCLASPRGPFLQVNRALCDFFGYDADTLMTKTWIELTHPDSLQADLDKVAEMVAGRIESYRMTKQFIHADGHPIWGDLSVGCLRAADGSVELSIGQIVDITDEVVTRQRLAESEAQNRTLADRLTAELSSAADYVRSILPDDLHGVVEVTSRYIPALELGGDGLHYRWLDDDHLKVYLIDVSGHGIRPALLSASVHNLIRTNSLPLSVLLNPDQVLNKLNSLFRMEDQGDTYFTIWYGVYQASSRTLRYASAGHPPALALNRDGESVAVTALSTPSVPVGMFDDAAYTSASYPVPANGQLLIYSDGAFEMSNAKHGDYLLSDQDFISLCADLAARPDWSLDTLVHELKALSPRREFDDDCALLLMTFP